VAAFHAPPSILTSTDPAREVGSVAIPPRMRVTPGLTKGEVVRLAVGRSISTVSLNACVRLIAFGVT
jgi:hypothetical protein